MKRIWSTAIVSIAVSAAASAQSGATMTSMTYTGCIESVNHGARFLLTHIVHDHEMTMGHDEMKHDEMMKKDSDMHGEQMMPGSLILAGRQDLKKHVGQKVAVTGSVSKGSTGAISNDLDTLTAGSLKVVAKACS